MRSGVLLLLFTTLRIFEASRIRVHLPLSYSPSRSQLLTILSRSRPADLPQGSNGVHGEIAWMIEKVWDYVIAPDEETSSEYDQNGNSYSSIFQSTAVSPPVTNDQLLAELCAWITRYRLSLSITERSRILHQNQLIRIVSTLERMRGLGEITFRTFLLTVLCNHLKTVIGRLRKKEGMEAEYNWYRMVCRLILFKAMAIYEQVFGMIVHPQLEMVLHSIY